MHDHCITFDLRGRPVIAGTQVTVEAVLRELADSEAVDAILTAYPELDRDAVQVALQFAAEHIQETARPSLADLPRAMGDFAPRTPLAKKLWERRKAVMHEAVERGDPLLHSWEEVAQEVRDRRGEHDPGEAQ